MTTMKIDPQNPELSLVVKVTGDEETVVGRLVKRGDITWEANVTLDGGATYIACSAGLTDDADALAQTIWNDYCAMQPRVIEVTDPGE